MEITVKIKELSIENIETQKKEFIKQASKASTTAHAPYSEFYVGCSVLLADGSIVLGSNQENASFPSGLCAERVALFECAKNLDNNKVTEIAVFAESTKYEVPRLLVPCAACLQVISDIENRQQSPVKIWMWTGGKEVYVAENVAQFLPFHFELNKK